MGGSVPLDGSRVRAAKTVAPAKEIACTSQRSHVRPLAPRAPSQDRISYHRRDHVYDSRNDVYHTHNPHVPHATTPRNTSKGARTDARMTCTAAAIIRTGECTSRNTFPANSLENARGNVQTSQGNTYVSLTATDAFLDDNADALAGVIDTGSRRKLKPVIAALSTHVVDQTGSAFASRARPRRA